MHQLIKHISLLIFLLCLASLSCQTQPGLALPDKAVEKTYPMVKDGPIRNIILFIGDGTGLAQITAGRIYKFGAWGRLNIERMPVTGLLHTHSSDRLITDSAAAGTALACASKTRNGMIGMNQDTVAVRSILELARDAGKSTGLVSTSSITHATPASFATHIDSRGKETQIAEQLILSNTDVLLGAGRSFFIPQDSTNSLREDQRNLLLEASQMGYQVLKSDAQLKRYTGGKVLGLFGDKSLKNERPEPTLAEMTRKAIDALAVNEQGFFLMVEGSQIDWGSHDNDLEYTLREMLAFDDAVQVGLEFAMKKHNALVVVTADHETGGLSIEGGDFSGGSVKVDWTSGGHTAIPVPIFAFGPHSMKFTGVYDNTRVPQMFVELWQLAPLPQLIQKERTKAE